MGIPAEKIILGGAFYGKIFENVDSINNGLARPGKFKNTVLYRNVSTLLSADSGWVYHWDEAASAPFLYNRAKRQFFTYDDEKSIELKTRYVIDNKLGGIMYWQLGGDLYNKGLLDVIDRVRRNYTGLKPGKN